MSAMAAKKAGTPAKVMAPANAARRLAITRVRARAPTKQAATPVRGGRTTARPHHSPGYYAVCRGFL
jgi:hypothetical protein